MRSDGEFSSILASPQRYLITLSARARTLGGIVPTQSECDDESNNPRQFSILDFRFWIVGKRIQAPHPRSSIHPFAQ
jgi:hypothetical protein